MKNTRSNLIKISLLGSLMLLVACAGPQLNYEPIPVTANPTEEATKLETALASARQQQVNVLAPTWFRKAEVSLTEAQKLIAQKGEIGEIGTNVSRGHAELAKAREMANISRTAIPEAIKGRDMARVAGATSFGDDYATVEAQFLDLTREIEDNNLSYAQRYQKKVVDAFQAIEIRAIKETTLGEVRKLLIQADKEGARRLAPEVLADAQQDLQDVDAFITANPYAKEEMHEKASAALFKANRLVQLTRKSEQLRKMQPIEVALLTEAIIQETAGKLGAADMRDQPFETQVENILGAADSLKRDQVFLAQKSMEQQAEVEVRRTQQLAELQTMRQEHSDELSTLTARQENEVGDLVKKVATLEGKSREEQARLEKMLVDQRTERVNAEAVQRVEQERFALEKRVAEGKLASERKFNAQYNQVQALFTKEEAECYKQGQQMVVRLRGMSFPVGQSMIMPENYALLSKVQQAVRTFESPDLTIEGHTDSTGAPELNNHLSQMRAEAVREYLLANGVSTVDKVAAVGYGPSRPLAPNTTSEGRAENRRIDLIITPNGLTTLQAG
jgi:outer membrane protein OmpA-like peptidoglycan-associated protein